MDYETIVSRTTGEKEKVTHHRSPDVRKIFWMFEKNKKHWNQAIPCLGSNNEK